MRGAVGLVAPKDRPLDKGLLPEEFWAAFRRDVPWVRYELDGDRALLRDIASPRGRPIPVRIVVELPPEAAIRGEPRIVLSTLDAARQRAGGLTIAVERGAPANSGGPFLPR